MENIKTNEKLHRQFDGNIETHTRLAELEKAHETDQLIRIMLDSNPMGANFWDKDLKLIDINKAAVSLFKVSEKKEFMEHFTDFSPEFQPDGRLSSVAAIDYMKEAFQTGNVRAEWMHQTRDGEEIPCEVTLVRVEYTGGHILAAYIRDLREHNRMMAETQKLLRDLEREKTMFQEMEEAAQNANKAKSAFLSTMSHEIRTPMNAIMGIAEIQLHNESIDKGVREGLERIYNSGDMLLGIINDILDLSKIEAGKLELHVYRYETVSLISDTAQLNMMRIGSKPIEFELEIDENLPLDLLGDELRVKQIFNNILSNAFKYTEKGMVKMKVTSVPVEGRKDMVTLIARISDTGQGMSKEQMDGLFEEYARFNQESNRSTEGTGLGMSITRNLVSLMDGEMTIESEPGKGSVFTVYLPQRRVGSARIGKEIADNLHSFRSRSRAQMKRMQITRDPMPYGSVLIVDDVETNIFVATGLLSPYALRLDSTYSGYGVIEKIKGGKEYDIILMDHMMPKMDGVETTKILREMGYTRPIVALTANAVAGQSDYFLENGFDGYISKPIDIRQLNSVLNKLIRDKQPPGVVGDARRRALETPSEAKQPAINPAFAEVFIRDAGRTIAALEKFTKYGNPRSEDDIRTYVIHAHGVKSALAYMGRLDLSAIALKLERLGRDGNIDAMIAETPPFVDSLREFVKKLKLFLEEPAVGAADEDKAFLAEKLLAIKAACGEYDEYVAEEGLTELGARTWSPQTRNLLDVISEKFLHSDFDEIAELITAFLEV